jgi:hypothetical protein
VTRTRGRLLLVVALVTLPGDGQGVEPRRQGQENFISRAVFAAGRLWLLTDAGDLSRITPGDTKRVPEPLPEPAVDLCVADGLPGVLTCPRDACKSVTFRRWVGGKWTTEAPVPLEGDRLVALACSPEGHTILTDNRLIETAGSKVSSRQLSFSGRRPRLSLVTSLHVTADHVFVGMDAGEWGGGLLRIDRETGATLRIEKNDSHDLCGGPLNSDCDPVNAIATEPWKPGCVAAAVGLVHFSPTGRIVEICGDDVRARYVKAFGPPRKDQKPWHGATVAFFGLARVGGALLAAGIDGVYRFDGSGEPRYAPLPKFDAIGGVGVSFGVPNAVLVLTAINSRRSVSGNVPLLVSRLPESKPYAWFDATFPKLRKLGTVAEPPASWRGVQTKDGLSMRLGGEFSPRNDSCWAAHTDKWPGPGWMDVCLGRTERELLPDNFGLGPAVEGDHAPVSDAPDMTDIITYDSWSAGGVMLRGRRAIVERGRANGGMAGHKRERTLRALVELGPGEWVTFTGRTGDDAGYDELLSIASTIEAAGP